MIKKRYIIERIPMPEFTELLKSVQENGRLMREDAERRSREWDKKVAQLEQERKEREQERQEREARWEKERKESERLMRRSDKRIDEMVEMFTGQWGKLVESLSTPSALELFKKLGIGITHYYDGPHHLVTPKYDIEVDKLLCNHDVMVAVEVKTTCTEKKVLHFLDQMKHFKEVFHPFKNMTVYGAVAALRYNDHSDKVALKNGLFVLHASGEGVFKMEAPAMWKIFGENNQEKEEDGCKLDS